MKTLLLALLLVQAVPRFPPPRSVDVNTATLDQLMLLDVTVTREIVNEIIKGRPYKNLAEVRARIPKEVFEKIEPQLRHPVQVISGNRIEKVQFDGGTVQIIVRPNAETKPAEQQPLPQETVEKRFRELSEEAAKVK
jgi:hypothetical protein